MRERDCEPGGRREIFFLAYPVVVSMMAHALMGLADTWLTGRISTAAQGAVGLANVAVWTFYAFFAGTLNGVNTFVSQKDGEGELGETGRFAWLGFAVAAVGGLLLFALHPLFGPLLRAIGTKPALAELAGDYGAIRLMVGGGFFFFTTVIVSFLRGLGDTRTPMRVGIAVVVINIPLSAWLMFGGLGLVPMGVAGAAWGTVLAQCCGLLVYARLFFSREFAARYGTRRFFFSWPELWRFLRVGAPIGGQWMLEIGGWMVFTAYVSQWGGPALASHQIVIQLLHVSFMPGVAISVAATTLVGRYIGAKSPDTAERSGHSALWMALLYMGMMGLVFFFFGGALTWLFNQDEQVVAVGRRLFMIAAFFQAFDALGIVSSGALRGAGDTRFPMLLSILVTWFVFVPSIYVFGEGINWGIYGAWVGALLYISLLGGLFFLRWKRGHWRTLQV